MEQTMAIAEDMTVRESMLLALPAEIRCKIWKTCIPIDDVVEVKLCNDRSADSTDIPPNKSPMMLRFQQLHRRQCAFTELGLNLRIINLQIRQESLPYFAQKTVRFCCKGCFEQFLKHIVASGAGVFWMRFVEVVVDANNYLSKMGYAPPTGTNPQRLSRGARAVVKHFLQEELAKVQKVAYLYYGRLDLMGRGQWETGDETEFGSRKFVLSGMFSV